MDEGSKRQKKKEDFVIERVYIPLMNGSKKHFKLNKKLGSGAYGDIYLGYVDQINETEITEPVAIKIGTAAGRNMLMREAKVYELFNNEYAGIPRMYGHGIDGDCYVMIMETLSSSLQDLLTESIFPLKAVLIVAVQALAHLEYIHSKSHIHGDLKPSNFLLGTVAKKKSSVHNRLWSC